MPKKKTRKSAAKRFKLTASGKVKFSKAGHGHLLSSKTRKRKRALKRPGMLSPPEQKRIAGLIS